MKPDIGHQGPLFSLRAKLLIALGVAALLLTEFFLALHMDIWEPSYLAVNGQLLETRIAVDYPWDGYYGGYILYHIEAKVLFTADGRQQERWLRASGMTSTRTTLRMKLASHPTRCTVYGVPGHLDHAKCQLP